MERARIVHAPLLAVNIAVDKKHAGFKLPQRRVPLYKGQLPVVNIGFHAVAGDADAEIGPGGGVLRPGDQFIILALDGAGIACGGGDDIVLDGQDLTPGFFRLIFRLGHKIAAIAHQLCLPRVVQGIIQLKERAVPSLGGDAASSRACPLPLAGSGILFDQIRPGNAEMAGQLFDLVHAGHLLAGTVGADGGLAHIQHPGNVDLPAVVFLHQPQQIFRKYVLVIADLIHFSGVPFFFVHGEIVLPLKCKL